MTADDLIALARSFHAQADCPDCSSLVCPGWESVPGGFDRSKLRLVGTLRDPANENPTLAEYHPAGTHGWSADAPIAIEWFPYNRCDVWRCIGCGRPFLRYTEFGGYYTDERIRDVREHLIERLAADPGVV
ncbi:hypothetical protein [Caldimonas sp. KR1-144]|uniref:hypothetical protein n=1 Tax=Caldimonas sp. KR1-144 TaxID=3400911 RepID=UPI003C0005AF